MALADKTLICVECGGEFIFTAGEQEFSMPEGFPTSPNVAGVAEPSAGPNSAAECIPTSPGKCIL